VRILVFSAEYQFFNSAQIGFENYSKIKNILVWHSRLKRVNVGVFQENINAVEYLKYLIFQLQFISLFTFRTI